LGARSQADLYQRLTSFWNESPGIVPRAARGSALILDDSRWPNSLPFAERMMALDTATYLPDDILVKVDRATMAVSLEGRVPFLDAGLFELAWRIPQHLKIKDGTRKWILRQVLYRHVPAALIERPKSGFGIPIDRWLRGPLREWAESLLEKPVLSRSGMLDGQMVRKAWRRYIRGSTDLEYHMWNVLMFQSWFEHESRP